VIVFTSVDSVSNSASGHLTHYSVDSLFVDQNGKWTAYCSHWCMALQNHQHANKFSISISTMQTLLATNTAVYDTN